MRDRDESENQSNQDSCYMMNDEAESHPTPQQDDNYKYTFREGNEMLMMNVNETES